ncbi:SDR family oxidoreductase [Vineibacter terrae]|uniref:SDR family oxidoreductase n=1 Tax=Vineibacter terrae TaxID=2586908 RepID=UPI002E341EC3|nr:SDR family oxidoreductase [Vineibacter terrae]HEX2891737.1 SDR family oxidoreductase [Vineibacter terrae]
MNVVGPSLLTAAALPCLAAARGKVINASHGIRVNAVAPGPTESGALTGMMGLSLQEAEAGENQERERIPLRRRGNPGDVARWIIQLADPASEWVTGQVIAVDGGLAVT